jgi:CDP-diglyceride synthetase
MDPSRIERGEIIAMAGGALLAIGTFLPWYGVENRLAVLNDTRGPATLSGWEAHPILRWLLLAAAAAPFILAWIIARDHELSWPRGQVTSVVAIAALGLLGYNGVIDRPGEPSSLVNLKWGWVVAVLGAVLMLVGSVQRQSKTEIKRKPPGTL